MKAHLSLGAARDVAAHAAWADPRKGKPASARLPSPLGGVVGRTEIVFRRRIAFVSSSEPRDSLTPNALGPLHLPGLLAREANTCHAPETAL